MIRLIAVVLAALFVGMFIAGIWWALRDVGAP